MALRLALDGVDPLALNLVRRTCVGDLTTRAAQHFGDRIAVVDGEVEISYLDLEARSNSVARGLLDAGLGHGDVVAMLVPNSWQFLATFFGCAKAGLIATPINLGLAPSEIAYILRDAGAEVVVVDAAFVPVLTMALAAGPAVRHIFVIADVDQHFVGGPVGGVTAMPWEALVRQDRSPVEVPVDDRDILHCLYTSGTTSAPKAVLTSHVAVTLAALSAALQFRHERGDHYSTFPIVLPLFHVTALDTLTLPVLLTGGTVVLHRTFDVDALLADLGTRRITHLMMLPIMWGALVERVTADTPGRDSVQMAVYAMAPMTDQRLKDVHEAFPAADVVLGSGQTEFTPPSVVQWPSQQWDKRASWGSAVATTDARIMNAEGRLLPRGEEGEIVYRGPQAMQGYGNNQAANAAAFAHGWFHSGDVGYVDDEGVVWFTDRIKDIVKTGGENVSSIEVERALLGHLDVADCAVIGLPDDRWGEAVTAVVVAAPGRSIDEEAIRLFAKERLAGYKVPKRIVVLEKLPKTATGKIQKHELRARLKDR